MGVGMNTMSSASAPELRFNFDEKAIDAVFRDVDQCALPGAAIGLAVDGRPIYRKGFGRANLELPVLLSPSIRLRIGSITKHFTALAWLLLCEDGLARPDDPIGHHLPEVKSPIAEATVEDLLGHTSGMVDALDLIHAFNGFGVRHESRDVLALYGRLTHRNAPAGKTWSYNNGAYTLVTAAIERVARTDYRTFLADRVFAPIGMHDTQVRRWDTEYLPNSAALHACLEGGGYQQLYLGTEMDGAGGIVSTIDDMLRWLAHMDRPIVGSAESWACIREPRLLDGGKSTGYGLGLATDRYRGLALLHHGGGVWGGNAQMLKVPELGLDLIIMVNRQDVLGAELGYRLIDACVEGLAAFPAPADATPPVGLFRSRDSGRCIDITESGRHQSVDMHGRELLLDEAPGQGDAASLRMAFERGLEKTSRIRWSEGSSREIRFGEYGTEDVFHREAPPEDRDFSRFVGTYACEAPDLRIEIRNDPGQASMIATGPGARVEYGLELVGNGLLRARADVSFLQAILVVSERGDTLLFQTASTRNLLFRRDGPAFDQAVLPD